jgi:hypothetical protein
VRVVDVWLEDGAGARVENVEQGEPIYFNLLVEARHDLQGPIFDFHVLNEDGVWVFRFGKTLAENRGADRIAAGQRLRIGGTIENPLVPGRYAIDCWMSRVREQGDLALHIFRLLDFIVYGLEPGVGSVLARAEVETVLERDAGP